jgi:dTDP-4-amino-4,6-dideoxygalactose transaminase
MKKINTPIQLFKVHMNPNAKIEVGKILDSGYIGQGPKVDEFEERLNEYFNSDRVVTLNSGTSGLHLALHLLKKSANSVTADGYSVHERNWPGIQSGDEILATALTCTASNWPILANGLKIKWVDIDEKTLNMDLDDLERKISPSTKAIIAVHWGGYPLDLDRLKKIQDKSFELYGFRPAIIEDGAHSFGSEYKGKKLGNHGNMVMYSLQAIKHITAIDGGLLVLPHQDLYNRAKLIRWYGIDRGGNRKDFRCEADIVEWGFKFHMNDVNASIGLANLKETQKNVIDKHIENGKYYDEALKGIKGVTLLERDSRMESSYWIYSLLVENRDAFAEHMKKCGIATSQVHERNDIHTCLSDYRSHLPNLDKIRSQLTAIPVGWWVSKEDREYIINCIKKGW